MAVNKLHVTFQGPQISEAGVSVEDLHKTFDRLQRALWLMVSHLEGVTTPAGRSPAWVRRGSELRLLGTAEGSLVAELGVSSLRDHRASAEDVPQKAVNLIMTSYAVEDDILPPAVEAELMNIGVGLSQGITNVRLDDPETGYFADFPRREKAREAPFYPSPAAVAEEAEAALLHGRLLEVDWGARTARLHRVEAQPVRLRFNTHLDDEMHQLARQYVEVRGRGAFDRNDRWSNVDVDRISAVRPGHEPFDLGALLTSPNPKIFRSNEVVRASEPFDVDEFNRLIRVGRDL